MDFKSIINKFTMDEIHGTPRKAFPKAGAFLFIL